MYHSWWILAIDFSDGQFLIAMRCRWFFHNSDAMSMFLAISYHRNRCDYFCSTIGTDCFPMFFQFQNQSLGTIFCGKPKDNGLYDMLKVATNCAYISALGVKGEKFTKMNISFGLTMNVYKIYDWIAFHMLWAAIKADKLLPSSKSYDFQCHNHNRCDYFCSTIGIDYFPMVFRWKIIANDVIRWLSIIGPAMRLYRCIVQV